MAAPVRGRADRQGAALQGRLRAVPGRDLPRPLPRRATGWPTCRRPSQHLFKADIEPSRVAAIIFEPVQGEGGFNVIQATAVKWLRELCDEHGIVLIADEIQTGFGRTGKLFAMRQLRRRARPHGDRQVARRRRAAVGRHRERRDHGCAVARRSRRHLCRQPARDRRRARGHRRHARGATARTRPALGAG